MTTLTDAKIDKLLTRHLIFQSARLGNSYYLLSFTSLQEHLYRPRSDPQPWNDPQIDPEMIPISLHVDPEMIPN